VLERHGVGRVAHADDGDGLVFLRDIVRRVINDSDNQELRGLLKTWIP
jgi:hypothetical protein